MYASSINLYFDFLIACSIKYYLGDEWKLLKNKNAPSASLSFISKWEFSLSDLKNSQVLI